MKVKSMSFPTVPLLIPTNYKGMKGVKILQSGMALVLVLWMVALLTIMAMGYSATMRTETRLTAHIVQSARARALSQAGIWYGLHELLLPTLEQTWRKDGTPYPINFGDGKISISLYDETGKIDLNTARPELLLSLIKSAGLGNNQSQSLLQAILDWRDRDNMKRNGGAEDEDYAQAGYDYGAKDGPFNSVGELREVMGMNVALFDKIAPALTVYSHQPAINPTVAPREVLLSIPGADPSDIDALLQRRKTGEEGNLVLPDLDSRYLSKASGSTFTVYSTGKSGESSFNTEAVILLKPNAPTPYIVLSWSEAVMVKKPQPGQGSRQHD